ncbi:MAG TPA: EAL domain-containing protein [Desulfobacteraceae bacterium]|nr:EAL domain-containing protein [Desulfobacteraceae bacterium]
MTLYRQLVAFTLVLFLLLFAGTWIARLQTTRAFLSAQLESHAQDTATFLGLSISQQIQDLQQDLPIAETMISAVFDRGYYRFIRLVDTGGQVLVDRTLEIKVEDVPDWFVRMFPLEAPEAGANVMAGWIQAGTLLVKSHPGYAYQTLWQGTVRMTWWFVACGVFVLVAGGIGLRFLLRPLVRVEQQAEALCRREYQFQERIPRTRELRRVVEVMNRMTRKVQEMFQEQAALAEEMRRQAYRDEVTGLGNRRYFDGQVGAHLDRRDSDPAGVILLVQIRNLERVNKETGRAAGDALLEKGASLIREAAAGFEQAVLARLSGADFGVYLPDAPVWAAETLAADILKRLGGLFAAGMAPEENVGHVGAATHETAVTLRRLLSEADLALRTAARSGPNAWQMRPVTRDAGDTLAGKQQWKAAIQQALDANRIRLLAQSVVAARDRQRILHLELFSQIVQDNGKPISAGMFLPFAEHLNLVAALDRLVLEQVGRLETGRLGAQWVAVNLSPLSLRDEGFVQWITAFLERLPAACPRIIFEFTEFRAVQHLELVRKFRDQVRHRGHAIGLDQYGRGFSHLGYLQSLRPEYVKIDRAYSAELKGDQSDSRFFIASLGSVAHSIDIAVIAEGVETESQLQALGGLPIDGLQGYLVDRPGPLEEIGKSG